MRRGLRTGAVGVLVAVGACAPAAAHVTVSPGASRPADLQRYTVLVPNEGDTATTGLDLQLPEGVDFVLVEAQPGWTSELVREGSSVRQVRWRGGSIPPGGYGELRLIVRNPVATGTVTFKAVQRYAGGKVQRWIGSPDADEPAPRVELSEDATPQDVVSTDGEPVPEATGAAGATGSAGPVTAAASPVAAGVAEPGRDGLTLGLAGGGLLLGAVALLLALGSRRRA